MKTYSEATRTMTPPILNDAFQKCVEEADKFLADFEKTYGRRRGINFFPSSKLDVASWLKDSPTCCGVQELTLVYMPQLWTAAVGLSGAPLDHVRKLVLAWVLSRGQEILDEKWMFHNGKMKATPGLVVYYYPDNDEFTQRVEWLKEWGFTNLLSFPNPIHYGHKLNMLACSTYGASKYIKEGEIDWLALSNTNPVPSVAPATM